MNKFANTSVFAFPHALKTVCFDTPRACWKSRFPSPLISARRAPECSRSSRPKARRSRPRPPHARRRPNFSSWTAPRARAGTRPAHRVEAVRFRLHHRLKEHLNSTTFGGTATLSTASPARPGTRAVSALTQSADSLATFARVSAPKSYRLKTKERIPTISHLVASYQCITSILLDASCITLHVHIEGKNHH